MVPPLFSGGLHIRTHKALSQSFCSVTAACRHSLLKGHPFVRCTAREGIPLQTVIAPLTSRQLSVMRPCSVLVSVIAFRVFAYYKIKGVKCQEERGDRESAPVSSLLQQRLHTLHADCQRGCIVEQRRGRRLDNACDSQRDERPVDAYDPSVVAVDPLHHQSGDLPQ